MNEKTLAVIALSNRDFPSFEARLMEARQWIQMAAAQGAELVVLPEGLNWYKGDGPGNPNALTCQEAALDDWENQTAILRETAVKCKVALTIPVLTREGKDLTNSFFLISKTGQTLGRYQKMRPTPGELREGVRPGKPSLIEWEGLKVGGAICFDSCFSEVFEQQVETGAQLFLMPSLWPGGIQLNHWALQYSTPIAVAYPAWSRIIDLTGQDLVAGGYRYETLRFGFGAPVYTATLNFDRVALFDVEPKIDEVARAYGNQIRITFDQDNCLFFLESRSPQLTVQDVMQEFDLVSAQRYFSDCRRRINHQAKPLLAHRPRRQRYD